MDVYLLRNERGGLFPGLGAATSGRIPVEVRAVSPYNARMTRAVTPLRVQPKETP